jgi:hypothetical protein
VSGAKVEMAANIIAGLIRQSGVYDYSVIEHDETKCSIKFIRFDEGAGEWFEIDTITYTLQDAETAKLTERRGRGDRELPSMYERFAKNMLFARCMSNGARWCCPDVLGAGIYTEGEVEEGVPESSPPSEMIEVTQAPTTERTGDEVADALAAFASGTPLASPPEEPSTTAPARPEGDIPAEDLAESPPEASQEGTGEDSVAPEGGRWSITEGPHEAVLARPELPEGYPPRSEVPREVVPWRNKAARVKAATAFYDGLKELAENLGVDPAYVDEAMKEAGLAAQVELTNEHDAGDVRTVNAVREKIQARASAGEELGL